jgi:hypothetical protein
MALNARFRHLNVAVRNETAHLVLLVVETMGPDRVLREIPDKILPVAAKFIQDGSAETRYAARDILSISSMYVLYNLATIRRMNCMSVI